MEIDHTTAYALFDLDNCISDDAWRIPRIAWHEENPDRRYAAYHALAPFDEPRNLHWVRLAMRSGRHPLFSTARPETLRVQTAEWIRRHVGVERVLLFMRAEGDHRRSVELKREHLLRMREHGISPQRILQAADDRPDVVAMYREHGIPASVLSIHNVCAYTPPVPQWKGA